MCVVLWRWRGFNCRAVDTSNVAVLPSARAIANGLSRGSRGSSCGLPFPSGRLPWPTQSYWFSRKGWPAMLSSGAPRGSSGIGEVSTCGVLPLGSAAGSAGVVAAVSWGPDGCGVALSKNRSSSTGKGSTRVEFFSAATSTTVCQQPQLQRRRVLGHHLVRPCASFSDACNSPSAVMTRARRSRSASAWRDDRALHRLRQGHVLDLDPVDVDAPADGGESSIRARPWFIGSRFDSRSSSGDLPMIERSEVWATLGHG